MTDISGTDAARRRRMHGRTLSRRASARPLQAVFLLAAACATACGQRWNGEEIKPARQAGDLGHFRLADHRGEVVVITFGFASCPDVCPLTLSRMKAAYRALGTDAARVAMAFVTVDPERDRPEALQRYVASFDRRIRSVHLEGRALADVLAAYRVTANKRFAEASRYRNLPGAGSNYSIDHTAGLFLADKQGRLRLRIAHDADPEAIASDVRRLLDERDPPPVRIEAPIARLTPAGIGAVYLRIVNPAEDGDRLVAARTTAAERVEMHESVRAAGDVVRMEARDAGFEVPPHATLDLAQGGKHLMLRGCAHLDPSKPIRITLHFARSGDVAVDVPIERREL
ncbi:MAG: SCO family protein [Myxococcales bacterium]